MSHTIALYNGATVTVPDLRGDVPVYRPPDRKEWARTKGAAEPYRLDLGDSGRKYISRAKGALARDFGTLSFDKAIAAQTNMDIVCLTVRGLMVLPEEDLVFFDSEEDCFWVYPGATK